MLGVSPGTTRRRGTCRSVGKVVGHHIVLSFQIRARRPNGGVWAASSYRCLASTAVVVVGAEFHPLANGCSLGRHRVHQIRCQLGFAAYVAR